MSDLVKLHSVSFSCKSCFRGMHACKVHAQELNHRIFKYLLCLSWKKSDSSAVQDFLSWLHRRRSTWIQWSWLKPFTRRSWIQAEIHRQKVQFSASLSPSGIFFVMESIEFLLYSLFSVKSVQQRCSSQWCAPTSETACPFGDNEVKRKECDGNSGTETKVPAP